MSIRRKWTLLLLAIVLISLGISRILYTQMTIHLADNLRQTIHRVLVSDAERQLVGIVDDFTRFSVQQRITLEMALHLQAEAVERCLAETPSSPSHATKIEDLGHDERLPEIENRFEYHIRDARGNLTVADVSFTHQSAFLLDKDLSNKESPNSEKRSRALADRTRLSTLTDEYHFIRSKLKGDLLWQYTTLESGVHTDYPGETSPLEMGDYDPRKRIWYTQAKKLGKTFWSLPTVDVTTGLTVISLSMPVYYPDGTFAGVTGMDLASANLFDALKLPPGWNEVSSKMLVVPWKGKLIILDQSSYHKLEQSWQVPVQLETLESKRPELLRKIQEKAISGKPGVIQMPYKGEEAFWAYGAGAPGRPFPIVIVPKAEIVVEADATGEYIQDSTYETIKSTGLLFLVVTVIVVVVGFKTAKRITQPIGEISRAASKLAKGDFDARADISTGDELEALAHVVNDAGAKFRERETMKAALAVAQEVQQRLLPSVAPESDRFDIVGTSLYCNETGGDYFDFMTLDHEKIGLAIADVSGHGIGPALLMASFRGALRSHAETMSDLPEELLGILNTYLLHESGGDQFVTAFYGVLNPQNNTFIWSAAGHDPALLLRRNVKNPDEIEILELPNTGLPLGIVEEPDYARGGPIELVTGDLILIGTDGIWETSDAAGEPFGKPRMLELLRESIDLTARAIREKLIDAVEQFRGESPQTDDVTLVVVKVQ